MKLVGQCFGDRLLFLQAGLAVPSKGSNDFGRARDKMPSTEHSVTELKRAYGLLGVPCSASTRSIKKSYCRIAKRWHPDLYATGTPSHTEATRMMKLINEAYSLVKLAPLRNYVETHPLTDRNRTQTGHGVNEKGYTADQHALAMTSHLDFWVRFVCGAILGTLIGLRLFFILSDRPFLLAVVIGSLVLSCGFGSANYGDKFWRAIFER